MKPMIKTRFLLMLALCAPLLAHAELQIDITQGVTDPISIAVVPFARAVPADGGLDVAAVVQRDLDSSGRFKSMQRAAMLSQPTRAGEVQIGDWRGAGNDYVVVGRVTATGSALQIDCELLNTLTGQRLGSQRVNAEAATLRNAAHLISDFVFEKIIGARGAFATRIAYVSVDGAPPSQHFQLIVADADGENPKVILASRLPIMSPAWSPDGQWLAYVSFESNLSAIYVQQLRTGERRRVSARAGVNGAPSFSPDGKQLALTLSGSGGNLDIYVLDLGTQALTRLTDDPAIDTEPAWSADGKQIYFTSDRAGGPQIYRLEVASPNRAQRVTFGSSYNARARIAPDGRTLALVTREGSAYRIALQDSNGNMRVLTRGALDESPSFAPNGMTLIYAGRQGGQGTLATVSIDGAIAQRLKSDQGEVREPVWGPFAP
jgi:TolB protein